MRLDTPGLLYLGAVPLASAGFSVYAPYDEDPIARALGISNDCLAHLNKTVEYWTEGEITSLCTPDCSASLNDWYASVEQSCSDDTIVISDKEIPPKMIPQKYIGGYNAVCLQDSLKNWCILESQRWYQNDIPRAKDGDVLEADDVLSMFSQDQYCSECFFLMWKEKLISPSAETTQVDAFNQQFQKVIEKCAADSPIIRRRNHVTYRLKQDPLIMAKEPKRIEPRDATGTYLDLPEGVPILHGTAASRCAKYYVLQEGDTCPTITRKFGISMARLMDLNSGIDKYCTTLWEGYAICVTESLNPVPPPAANEVTIQSTPEQPPAEEPAVPTEPAEPIPPPPVEDPEPEKHVEKPREAAIAEPVFAETVCSCVDGEEKIGCHLAEHAFLADSVDSGYKKCQAGACDKSLGQVSVDGKCGPKHPGNMTCVGSKFGKCGIVEKIQDDEKEPAKDEPSSVIPDEPPKEGSGQDGQDGGETHDPPKEPEHGETSPVKSGDDTPKPDEPSKEPDGGDKETKTPDDGSREPDEPPKETQDGDKKLDDSPGEPDELRKDTQADDDKKPLEGEPQEPQEPAKGEPEKATQGDGDITKPPEPGAPTDEPQPPAQKEEEARVLRRRTDDSVQSQRFAPHKSHFIHISQESGNDTEVSPIATRPVQRISLDGRCGNGVVCEGSVFGKCCSKSGYCGNGPAYCGMQARQAALRSKFAADTCITGIHSCHSGLCDTAVGQVSIDGRCGPKWSGDMTCVGSKFGDCCSVFGFCGSGPAFCAPGQCASGACQKVTVETSGEGDSTPGEGNPEKVEITSEDKPEEEPETGKVAGDEEGGSQSEKR
ncbi:hypothetical protein KEM52_006682 [Ascosphaera acerosa]|nr:hypothetical protein KEM52_006682 [Ascosphaera acerosa]